MEPPLAPQYILAPSSLALLEMALPCTIERFRRSVFVLTIRLSRIGKKKKPFYRVVVIERTRPRDGRVVDAVGTYDPLKKPAEIKLDVDRVKHWLSKGAQPSDTVRSFFKLQKIA
jgi:small subunit ribosomal protein S16